MTYSTGTLATTGSSRDAIRAVLDTALTANGWTIVGNFTDANVASDVPDFYRVYKSAKATSGLATDMYFITWLTGNAAAQKNSGEINYYSTISEDFDTSTSKVSKFIPNGYNFQNTADGYVQLSPQSPTYTCQRQLVCVTGGSYWISVTPQRICVATRGASGSSEGHLYAGSVTDIMSPTVANTSTAICLTPMAELDAPYTALQIGWTREPGPRLPDSNSYIFAAGTRPTGPAVYDNVYSNSYYLSPVLACHRRNGAVPRGFMPGVYAAGDYNLVGGGVAMGDTMTIGQKTYVAFSSTTNGSRNAAFFVDTTL